MSHKGILQLGTSQNNGVLFPSDPGVSPYRYHKFSIKWRPQSSRCFTLVHLWILPRPTSPGRTLERALHKRWLTNANKYMRRCSTSQVLWKCLWNHNGIAPHTKQKGRGERAGLCQVSAKRWCSWNIPTLRRDHWKNCWHTSQDSLLGICQQKCLHVLPKIHVQERHSRFISNSLTLETTQCLSAIEWINQFWYTQTME